MGWGFMGLGWLIWIILLIVIIWGIVKIAGSTSRQNQLPPAEDDAIEILKKRYARGEISREQFEEMKKDLQS
ncbi:MAG: SHOCT domain-containing protein [Calditrichaeota bacterium]|nr:MAG: SHOCT domain-containing protein [Calditrichota bacterium]